MRIKILFDVDLSVKYEVNPFRSPIIGFMSKMRFSTMTKACNHFGVSGSGKSLSKLKSKRPYGAIVYSTTGEEL